MLVRCPDCETFNYLYDSSFAHAYECCVCVTPHWIDEDCMWDYMNVNMCDSIQAEDDLNNRIPYFADSSYESYDG